MVLRVPIGRIPLCREAALSLRTRSTVRGIGRPALRVTKRGCADRRIPFERISRVVVSGRVSWSTDALLECADQGVVVCFLKGDGMPRARWIGRATNAGSDAALARLSRSPRLARPPQTVEHCEHPPHRTILRPAHGLVYEGRREGMNRAICRANRAVASIDEMRIIRRRLYGLAVARALEALVASGLGATALPFPASFPTSPRLFNGVFVPT